MLRIRRRPWLDSPDEGIYRDRKVDVDLAFVTTTGLQNKGVFMAHANLAALQKHIKERLEFLTRLTADMYTGTPASERSRQLKAAVGNLWVENGTQMDPVVPDQWIKVPSYVLGLITLGQLDEARIRNEGGGSRLPSAYGQLFFQRDTYPGKDQALTAGMGVPVDEIDEYGDVTAVPVTNVADKLIDAQIDGATYVEGSNALYVSLVTPRPRANRTALAARRTYSNFQGLGDGELAALQAAYERLSPATFDTGWVDDLAGGRDGSQSTAMGNWSAYGAALFHNTHRRDRGGEVPLEDNWEWLHIRGAQIGGETNRTNLLAGTFAANSMMIPYEAQLQEWHVGQHGKIWARFTAETLDLAIAAQIRIEVAALQHPVLGTISREEPLSVTFRPLDGRVVDRLLGYANKRAWEREAHERGTNPTMGQLIGLDPQSGPAAQNLVPLGSPSVSNQPLVPFASTSRAIAPILQFGDWTPSTVELTLTPSEARISFAFADLFDLGMSRGLQLARQLVQRGGRVFVRQPNRPAGSLDQLLRGGEKGGMKRARATDDREESDRETKMSKTREGQFAPPDATVELVMPLEVLAALRGITPPTGAFLLGSTEGNQSSQGADRFG